jgi:hypothetical protein
MHMRFCLPVVAALTLCACSDNTTETKKAPPPPPQPLTGRQAFQQTYPQAHIWATDCQPLSIRSFNLPDPKSADGKAGAWEILYVSQSRAMQRTFSWSAVESEGNLHKGVYGALEQPWHGPTGQAMPFLVQALKIDTPQALETAIKNSAEFLNKNPNPPQVNFILEYTPRYADPAWRVFWGQSISAADWSVFIDASTGAYLGR